MSAKVPRVYLRLFHRYDLCKALDVVMSAYIHVQLHSDGEGHTGQHVGKIAAGEDCQYCRVDWSRR